MKTKDKIKGLNPFKVFRKNHPLNSFLSIILALAVLNLSNGCAYYKVKDLTTSEKEISNKITDINKAGYYAIIHSDGKVFHLNNIKIDQNRNTISGISEALVSEHVYKNARKEKGPNRFKKKTQDPISEIHINLKTKIAPEIGTEITIPMEDIHSLSLNKRDGLAEFAVVMLGAGALIGSAFLIILALKSSCPFVYVKVGDTYQFVGELYPGVLTENMQRDDYIPLGTYFDSKTDYSIKVTNELKEIQHTDVLELIVVNHPQNIKVLLDDNGKIHTFSNLNNPNQTVIDNLEQDTSILNNKDNNFHAFNGISNNDDNKRHVIMEFDSPKTPSDAKLFLTVKNSMWLDYIFGKFNQKFGNYYPALQAQQQKQDKDRSEKWINEQHIPLSIYVETPKGWELIKNLNSLGPLAFRDIVIPIDSKYITKEKLNVKLETGFMFWEVDFAAIDYSDNLPLEVNYISPHRAIDQNNNEVTDLLNNEDLMYFTQSNIGDQVTVMFNFNNVSVADSHSVFLKNRGYYNYIRDYSGKPNLESLKIFLQEGSFTDFSKLEYYSIMGIETSELVADTNE